ncbi:hypothetical protein Tco_0892178 [Tanacetum coccineum]|uniref:Uncharacterized protein n=1 Tax=Tanacetum coccineum TaxID=301880 RepID=A0ABQ5C5E7_9ASTR
MDATWGWKQRSRDSSFNAARLVSLDDMQQTRHKLGRFSGKRTQSIWAVQKAYSYRFTSLDFPALLVFKPTTLGEAFSLARVTEETTFLPTPTESTTNTNTTPLAIKWISQEERQKRLNKGLCFNCDNKWMRGHKCLGKFLLHMAEEDDNPGHEIPAAPAYYLEDKMNFEGERNVTTQEGALQEKLERATNFSRATFVARERSLNDKNPSDVAPILIDFLVKVCGEFPGRHVARDKLV